MRRAVESLVRLRDGSILLWFAGEGVFPRQP
jgi:hypothetical protein